MSDLSDAQNGAYLAHFGVVGMKWGKRSGGMKSRVTGALLDSNQRRSTSNKAIATGNGKARDYGRAIAFRPTGPVTAGSKKVAAGKVKSLGGQRKRIEKGKLKAKDVLELSFDFRVADLVVSRRDKRG